METTEYKYRIWCKTEDKYVYVWDTETPTQCPNDSTHIIFTSTVTIVSENVRDPSKDIHVNISGKDTTFKYATTGQWESIANFIFAGTHILGIPTTIKIIAQTSNPQFPGQFRLIDSSNGNEIVTWNNIDAYLPTVYTDYSLSNIPTTETVLELQGKSISDLSLPQVGASSLVMIF